MSIAPVKPKIPTSEALTIRMKAEISADIAAGTVPATVATFGDLHDHVDANEYGGACGEYLYRLSHTDDDLNAFGEQYHDAVEAAQNACNAWLRSGRPAESPGEPEDEGTQPALQVRNLAQEMFAEAAARMTFEHTGGGCTAAVIHGDGVAYVIGHGGFDVCTYRSRDWYTDGDPTNVHPAQSAMQALLVIAPLVADLQELPHHAAS